ncbi:MAG: leucine-rich repeat protein [Clostridia bacterium]|nr:leucine-rich repeat protein [Clostridia bacterium]
MKKLVSLITALAVCVSLASCAGDGGTTDVTKDTSTTVTTNVSTTATSSTLSDVTTTLQTTETSDVKPQVQYGENEVVTLEVGKYVKLKYNPAYCSITTNVEPSVGGREKVSLFIIMRDGFTFDGWSQDKAIPNGGSVATSSRTYNISASKDVTVWANYSANIIYDPNGGKVKSGGETYNQEYSVVWFRCPNTLTAKDYFVRDGYTLVEYNTKADGTGTAVGLGSRTVIPAEGKLTLYCIWEKQNDAADFETKVSGKGVAITKYKGTASNVVIPDTIGGKTVVAIASGAFKGSSAERVVLTPGITTIENGAFENCKKLETLVMFDSLMSVSSKSFSGTTIKNLRVNAALDMYKEWTVGMINVKLDSFLYATSQQKDIFAIYGGSGSYYGFDCEAIDEALDGKYEVINLGCNAQLTAAIMFEYMSHFLGENDIVLWAPESGNYMFGAPYFHGRTWEFLVTYYDIFRYVDISNYSGVFDYYASFASSHAQKQQSFESFSADVNSHGDHINTRAHADKTYRSYSGSYQSRVKEVLNGNYSYIEGIIENMSKNGVKLYYTFAAMDESAPDFDDDVFENLAKAMEDTFGMIAISDYKNCLVPHDCMYDSEWHLTLEGAKLRTQSLIKDILAQIAKEGT